MQRSGNAVSSQQSAKSVEANHNNTVFARIEERPCFRNTTLLVIVANAIWIAVDVEWNHSGLRLEGRLPLEPTSTAVEFAFCAYFSAELAIRFLAFRRKLLCIWDKWFVFDAVLVAFMVLETWVLPLVDAVTGAGSSGGALSNLSSFRLLRLLRLTRMAKIMRYFPELLTLVRSIVDATQAVFFILLFLVIVIYVFAIVFTSQLGRPAGVGAEDPNAEGGDASGDPTALQMFSDLGSSMMTLFTNGVLADNLAQTLMAIKVESVVLMWLFVLFVLISGVTLLNMLIGVLCQVIDKSSKEEEEAKQLEALRITLTDAFRSVDNSMDGKISEEEWARLRDSAELRESLARLGIDGSDMEERVSQMQESLFNKTLTGDTTSSLTFEEFVERVMEMRRDAPARALDVELLKATISLEDSSMRRRLDRIEADLSRLLHGPSEEAKEQPAQALTVRAAAVASARGSRSSGAEAPKPEAALAEVPTELLFHVLKARE